MKKLTIKNLQIEITSGGDIIIGKKDQKYLTIKNDGTLELQGSTGAWGGFKADKYTLMTTLQSFVGSNTQIYQKGSKLIFAGVDSSSDPHFLYIDFEDATKGVQYSATEP